MKENNGAYKPEDYHASSYKTSREMDNPKLSPSDFIKKTLDVNAFLSTISENAVSESVNNPKPQNQIIFAHDIPAEVTNKKGVRVEVDYNGNATLVDENGRYGSLNNISADEYAKWLGYDANKIESRRSM